MKERYILFFIPKDWEECKEIDDCRDCLYFYPEICNRLNIENGCYM